MANTPELVEAGLRVLLDYAARGDTLTYGALNRDLGEPFRSGPGFPGQIGTLCDEINAHHDTTYDLPFMISALVHSSRTHLPGPGFYSLASELGLLPKTEDPSAKRAFVNTQLDAIHKHYAME